MWFIPVAGIIKVLVSIVNVAVVHAFVVEDVIVTSPKNTVLVLPNKSRFVGVLIPVGVAGNVPEIG
jgi:hypothetical protein